MARIASLRAGLPVSASAQTVNRFCASGLEAIAIAAERIRCRRGATVVLAGGTESMSLVPMGGHTWRRIRTSSRRYPDVYLTTGLVAENHAREVEISRDAQDAFALRSHGARWRRSTPDGSPARSCRWTWPWWIGRRTAGRPSGVSDRRDEGPRRDTSADALAKLRPAFHATGTVTAGNSSQTSDGAAAVLVMSAERAAALGLTPLARVRGLRDGRRRARALRHRARCRRSARCSSGPGSTLDDIDLVEINEAFAAQVLACLKELPIDPDRLNVNGGAIALGHPLGCTGARLTTLDACTRWAGARRATASSRSASAAAWARPMRSTGSATVIDDHRSISSGRRLFSGGEWLTSETCRPTIFTPRAAERRAPARSARRPRSSSRRKWRRRSTSSSRRTGRSRARSIEARRRRSASSAWTCRSAFGGVGLDKVVRGRRRRGGRARPRRSRRRSARRPASRSSRSSASARRPSSRSTCRASCSGEIVGAYCLSESGSGSDALGARTRGDARGRRLVAPHRREAVDHERRLRRPLHRLCEGRRRAVLRVHRRARFPGRLERQGRAQDGPARLVDDAGGAAGRARCRRRTCSARSAAGTRSRSTC